MKNKKNPHPVPPTPAGRKTFIAGIGASAGGLEALTQLIGQLRPGLSCAYVVLQHLSPSYRSMMAEILGRETDLRVKELEQGDVPEPGVVYVVPSNANALLKDGRLVLVHAPPEVVPKPSINQFFISLAAEEGESAIGVILSGTGSDGVAGLRAIQAAGGFTLVQQPDTAKYDGMPRAAIEAGVADHVLAPDDIAAQIARLLELPAEHNDVEAPVDLLASLFKQLRERLDFDFSGYKMGTLMRRIRRRQFATGCSDMPAYLKWVESNPEELDHLARDILISVTAFFRDRDAFVALRQSVADIVARKPAGSEIRVWVAGCASGEEAYSIAMLFAEALGDRLMLYRIQIFATDIDDDALNVARRGVYPAASTTEVPAELLERFFRHTGNTYEAGKQLRDMIVFARHNLVSDPPFLRLDLVSCRNVLIYFDAPLQAKVLQTFHFGMNKEGVLFLGRSESIAQAEQLFVPLNRRERLFHASGEVAARSPQATVALASRPREKRRESQHEILLKGLVSGLGVTVVMCDRHANVLHAAGDTERFLHFPAGASRLSLPDLVAPALRAEVIALMRRCDQQAQVQCSRPRRVGEHWIKLVAERVSSADEAFYLFIFCPEPEVAPVPGGAADVHAGEADARGEQALADELMATREHLQALIEEMATANEEMQALNEEAQASNEELQATNEELEAANEEMQATNEELVSLNEELNVKTVELSGLYEEYAHLYDALEFPVLVFDRELQLTRFNAPAARRFDLRTTALRQHLARLKLPVPLPVLETLLGRAMAHGDREQEMVMVEDRHLRIIVTPGLNKRGDVRSLVASFIDVSDIVRTQVALSESEQRLHALMDKTTVMFAMRNLAGQYLYVNRRFVEFFGLEGREVVGANDFSLFDKTLAGDIWGATVESMRTRSNIVVDHRLEREAETRYLRAVHQTLSDEAGQPVALIFEAEDVTASRHAEEQLRITAKVFDHAGEAIVVTDPDGFIQTVNSAFCRITGYGVGDAMGRQIGRLLRSGRHSREFYEAMWQALKGNGFWQGEIWNKRKNGEIFPEWLTINRVEGAEGQIEHFVAVFSDISDIKNAQRRAEYLATHDPLTRLPNRSLFQDRLRQSLAHARRHGARVALMFIDLDNFKTINDTLGHDIGDELLKAAALRLQQVVRDFDTVARLGGDEFTAILGDCDADGASLVAKRVVDELSTSFDIEGRKLFVSASVGIAFYPEDGQDSNTLVKAADTAMYRAKELGRNRVEFFVPDLHVRLLKRATLESALRAALEQKRLRLVFQPQFTACSERRLIGAEALVRWKDPVLGEVSPAEFIPMSESSGLILEVSKEVERLLIEHLHLWITAGMSPPPISLNCSPRSMREPDMALRLISALKRAAVPAELLCIEITEGALLENTQHVTDNLGTLARHGIRISVDDFGTGYSSLIYLKRLPLSELKVDKSFVDGLGEDQDDEAIAEAILGLAHSLGLDTVAEGVETERQLEWLRRHGCKAVQGYLFSRPLEAGSFEAMMEQRHHDE